MRKLYICILLLLVLGGYPPTEAQELKIRVLDKNEMKPVFHASVVYSTKEKSGPNLFGFTDEDGWLQLQPIGPEDTLWLNLHHLNYQALSTVLIPPHQFEDGEEILLTPRDHELQEVQIEAPAVYGESTPDTLTYVVDSIRTLSSAKIEEVLREIEGLNIDGDRITFRGKAVSRVFLDGVDVAADSYMTLVDAINSDIIEEIDIVSNYNPNPILSDFRRDETVINLKSNNRAGYMLSGNAGLGLSHNDLLMSSVDLTGISPYMKNIFRFTRNRVSQTVYRPASVPGEISPLRLPLGQSSQTYSASALFSPVGSSTYRFDQSVIGGAVLTGLPIGRTGNLRNSNYIQKQELDQSNFIERRMLLPDTTYMYNYDMGFGFDQYFIRSETEFDYYTEQSFINLYLIGNLPFANSSEQKGYSGQIADTISNHFELDDSYHLEAGGEYSRLLGDWVLHIENESSLNKISERWINNNARTTKLRGKEGPFIDRLEKRTGDFETTFSLHKSIETLNLSTGLVHHYHNTINRLNNTFDPETETLFYQSKSEYNTHSIGGLIEISGGRERGPIQYRLSAQGGFTKLDWSSRQSDVQKRNFPHFSVGGNLNRNLRKGRSISFNYHYDQQVVRPQYFLPDSLLLPTYSIHLGYEGKGYTQTHQFNILYKNIRIDKLFDFNINMDVMYHPTTVVPDVVQFLEYNQRRFTEQEGWSQSAQFNWTQHFIDSYWHLEGRVRIGYNQMKRRLNHIDINTHYHSYSNQLTAIYRKRTVELQLVNELFYTRIRTEPTFNRINNLQWAQEAGFKYKSYSDKLQARLSGKYYRFTEGGDSFISLDFSIRYHPTEQIRLRLRGHNLLGQDNFTLERFTPHSISAQSFGLRERFVGLFLYYFFS